VRSRRGQRITAAFVATGFVAAIFLLPARRPLPFDVCLFHRFTGLPCLTCGLTRSVCLFARGEWSASLSMHPAGGLAFGALIVASLWLLAEAAAGRDLKTRLRTRLFSLAFWAGVSLSVLTWTGRLSGLLPSV
jgi:uncharacterized protein DUF2752